MMLASIAKPSPPTRALHDGLEELAEHIAVAEPAVPVLREARVIRHRVLEAETAEPAIRKVEVHLLAQSTLRTNAEAVADQQHPHHQLRIDRRTAGVAVERGELLAQLSQIEEPIDAAEQMIRGNVRVQIERVEQSVLRAVLLTHHAVAVSLQAST